MNQVECGRNEVWGGCEESLINSHFQSVVAAARAGGRGRAAVQLYMSGHWTTDGGLDAGRGRGLALWRYAMQARQVTRCTRRQRGFVDAATDALQPRAVTIMRSGG